MKNNKTFTLIALIIFLQFFNINLRADDLNKIDEEELPAQDPFISGNATTSVSEGEINQVSSFPNDINGIRLIGTVLGESRNIALISTPDGSTRIYGENEIIFGDIQLLDVSLNWISVRLNAEENYDININGQIMPQEGN
tara:strand:+ start:232 stop:651 length:420 start_codon:yes stop_codon:yes gene_type:complete